MNLGCPPGPTTIEAKAAEIHLGEVVKDPTSSQRNKADLFPHVSFFPFWETFTRGAILSSVCVLILIILGAF